MEMNDMEIQPPSQGSEAVPSGAGGSSNPLVSLPITSEEIQEWWDRIDASTKRREAREKKWDVLLKEYTPVVEESGSAESVKVPIHFRNVHSKIGQLFVRSPEVRLVPKGPAMDQVMIPDPNTGMMRPATPEEVIPIRQAVINNMMGRGFGKINGTRLMDECLFDILAWAGIAAVKVGYRAVIKETDEPILQPDPSYAPPPVVPGQIPAPLPPPPQIPVMDPMTGQPMTRKVPVVVHECWYADRFSPKKLLLDELLTSTRYQERSRWIGHEFFMSKRDAMRSFNLSEDDLKTGAEDDRVFKHSGDDSRNSKEQVHGYELFVYAHYFSEEVNPEIVYHLVLFEGMKDKVAVYRASPDQQTDQRGKLTDDSLRGFPIKVGCIRDFADSPYPEADSAFVNSSVKELNTFRRQAIKRRDAAIGKYFYDTGAIDDNDLKLMQTGEVGTYIGIKEGLLMQGADKIFYTTAQVKGTQDDYQTSSALKQDINETLGISGNTSGVELDTVRSAREVSAAAGASAGRMQKEQALAVEFYLEIVEAVDTLVVRYATQDDYVQIVGEDGSRRLAMWNKKIIQGRYAFDIEPDSQLTVDAARSFQLDNSFYNLVAKDPLVNRIPILRKMAIRRGYDPYKVIADPATQTQQPGYGDVANKHENENSGQEPGGAKGNNRDERNPA